MYYTYAHYTKDTNKLFYIGKGTFDRQSTFKRANAKVGRNNYWHNKVKKHDGFTVKILACWKNEQEAFCHEEFLISIFKDDLVNLTSGGEGTAGRKQTQEEKDKRANKLRGQKRTSQILQKMSEAQKKNKVAIEALEKARKAQKKKILCVDTGIIYDSLLEASKQTGIVFQNISKVCKKQRPSAGGYSWEFIDGKS